MTYVLIIMLITADGASIVAVPGFATAQLCETAAQSFGRHQRAGAGYRILLHTCAEHSPSKVEAERSKP